MQGFHLLLKALFQRRKMLTIFTLNSFCGAKLQKKNDICKFVGIISLLF